VTPVVSDGSAQSNGGVYQDGIGEEMSKDDVREMLWIYLLDGWNSPYEEIDVTLHHDGGATVHLKLSDDDVRGLAQTW
jgi:hypothetical protein